jgi:endonuclease YncB( thermonuclease family)
VREQVLGETVECDLKGTDRYCRRLAVMRFEAAGGAIELNSALVSEGLAWRYARFDTADARLDRLQQEAHRSRKGLWREDAPTAP